MGVKSPTYVAGLDRGVRPIGDWSISMTLSTPADALERVVLAGILASGVERARQGPVQDLRHERALAASRDAGHGRQGGQREGGVDVLEVVLARALHDERLAVARPALARDGHCTLATQVGAGDRARLGQDVTQGTRRDHLAAVLTRAGPDVEHPVGRPDGLLVVLHDDQRVAQLAQPDERRDQLGVVLLVQADGRLVEDVQHAHQARADLRRQPDALRLAAAQG